MAALTVFCNNFDPYGSLVNYMTGENAIHCSFGENPLLFGSPGMSWCGSLRPSTSFSGLDLASISNDLGEIEYPTAEDLLLGGDASECLRQLNEQQQQQPNLVGMMHTPQSQGSASERYRFEHQELNQLGNQIHYQQQQLLEKQLHLADLPQTCVSGESGLAMQDVVSTVAGESESFDEVEVIYEPPPLNKKRLERIEDVDESIEAAEVSVDLIQNRRPFQCGLPGCNKTFKNPQTMKMHHKTHYTDGSAVHGLLPILTTTTASNAANNSKLGQSGKKIPSRCPKCRKTFVGLYELRRHYGRKHSEGEKPFGCRKCSKKFYIEVDVRDHEKLCGEPIECPCGLRFAFKCNLIAHKKAHPSCQQSAELCCKSTATTTDDADDAYSVDPVLDFTRPPADCKSTATTSSDDGESQSSGTSNAIASSRYLAACSDPLLDFTWLPEARATRCKSTATTTSDDDGESQSSGTRKRDAAESNSIASLRANAVASSRGYLAAYSVDPVLDFAWLPEAKAARYHFTGGLEFCAEESVWGSHNLHYPSFLDFPNLPSLPSAHSVFEPLAGHSESFQARKHEPAAQVNSSLDSLHFRSSFNIFHDAMARLN